MQSLSHILLSCHEFVAMQSNRPICNTGPIGRPDAIIEKRAIPFGPSGPRDGVGRARELLYDTTVPRYHDTR